jgi:riboflavin synthase
MWDGTKAEGFVLRIKCAVALKDAYIGASIAVNGTCLTVTEFDTQAFEVNCAPETLRRTNLVDLEKGSLVNLERAMAASDRNSGHAVQGHVDETGKILDKKFEGDCLWIKISLSKDLLPFVVPKGYIAVDGTSLTVCEVNHREQWFNLMLIAHTQKCIIVPKKKVGERVNLEADAMGKYALSVVGGVQERVKLLEQRLQVTQAAALGALAVAAVALYRGFRS